MAIPKPKRTAIVHLFRSHMGGRHSLHPVNGSWLYLAVIIGLCSRRIVGWSVADHMRSDLVLDAFHQALQTRPTHRTIFQSVRCSLYVSTPFRNALAKAGLRGSMSARANPYDNAWPESFIGSLKHDRFQGGCFESGEVGRFTKQ